MDLTWLKDAGVTGWPLVLAVAVLILGQKLLDIFKTRVDQFPAMAANRLAVQQQSDATAAGQMAWMMVRLTAAEARLDQKDKDMAAMADEMRSCEHRYAVVCQVLAKHGIPIPPEVT